MKDKRLIRIIVTAVLFVILLVLEKIITFPIVNGVDLVSLLSSIVIYLIIGYDVIIKAGKNISHGQIFDENFLMIVASVGALVIGQYLESIAVMLFYQVGELFQDYAVSKSRKSIAELMDIKSPFARVLREGKEVEISPEDIEINDKIIVRNGEKIPVDGTIEKGQTQLDTKALTGESVLRNAEVGDQVLSGSINVGNVITLNADKIYFDSTVSKILDLVENVSGKKSKQENFITKFAKYYTPIVCGLAVIIAIVPSLITKEWSVWVFRALTFLVVSCPCALVISVPLSFFGGIGGASKYGILVKGGSYLEKVNSIKTIIFDKTGTLTKGTFEVSEVYPNERKEEIINLAAIAENGSNHPIAKSIIKAATNKIAEDYNIKEVAGQGVIATKNNEIILVGNEKLMTENAVKYEIFDGVGTCVYVAKNGEFVGYIVVSDVIKEESKEVITKLNESGIKTVMLTGDMEKIANNVAKKIGISSYKSSLLPSDKVSEVEKIMEEKSDKESVAFVGDGINDAPVLMRADVGISMGNVGSDSAIEASDVVLMRDDLKGLLILKKVAKKTLRIVKENIYFALFVKFAVLILSVFGIANMWIAVFADVGVSIIAIVNAMRCMRIK